MHKGKTSKIREILNACQVKTFPSGADRGVKSSFTVSAQQTHLAGWYVHTGNRLILKTMT